LTPVFRFIFWPLFQDILYENFILHLPKFYLSGWMTQIFKTKISKITCVLEFFLLAVNTGWIIFVWENLSISFPTTFCSSTFWYFEVYHPHIGLEVQKNTQKTQFQNSKFKILSIGFLSQTRMIHVTKIHLRMWRGTKKYQFCPKMTKFWCFFVLRKQAKLTFSIKCPRKSARYRMRK
jgi:hypothetical protein